MSKRPSEIIVVKFLKIQNIRVIKTATKSLPEIESVYKVCLSVCHSGSP